MEKEYSFNLFLGETVPFTSFRNIFFKPDSEAFELYGSFVFGRFLVPVRKKNEKEPDADKPLKIDAARVNGYNKNLSPLTKTTLYYKGVSYADLDVLASYPEFNNKD